MPLDHLGVQAADVDRSLALPVRTFTALGSWEAMRCPVGGSHAGGLAGDAVVHAPREWPEYHPGYGAAFLRDLGGHDVEAVHHGF